MAVVTRKPRFRADQRVEARAPPQNFVTLVLIEPRGDDPAEGRREIARLIAPELRETDLLAVDDTAVSVVPPRPDLQNSMGVIDW